VRWLTLYARSRQVPVSLAAVVIGTVLVWTFARDGGGGPADAKVPVFVLVASVVAASVGLGGQDLALDRTAAIPWRLRRAAHVLLVGVVAAAALLTARAVGEESWVTTTFIVRDSAGLTGLVALGAVLGGAQYAWTPPIAWLAYTVLAPSPTGLPTRVASWMLLPPGAPAAAWTALALALTGTAAYAFAGPRR
jgi:hypothetical protein